MKISLHDAVPQKLRFCAGALLLPLLFVVLLCETVVRFCLGFATLVVDGWHGRMRHRNVTDYIRDRF